MLVAIEGVKNVSENLRKISQNDIARMKQSTVEIDKYLRNIETSYSEYRVRAAVNEMYSIQRTLMKKMDALGEEMTKRSEQLRNVAVIFENTENAAKVKMTNKPILDFVTKFIKSFELVLGGQYNEQIKLWQQRQKELGHNEVKLKSIEKEGIEKLMEKAKVNGIEYEELTEAEQGLLKRLLKVNDYYDTQLSHIISKLLASKLA